MAQDGQTVDAGDVLVKIPRETAKQKDITGGLPRVVELFEARRPKEPAVITEVNGLVKFGDVAKSHRKELVVTPDGEEHEYQLPRGAHVNVREGEAVVAGDPLMDGPIDPHDILKVMASAVARCPVTRRMSMAAAHSIAEPCAMEKKWWRSRRVRRALPSARRSAIEGEARSS